MADPITAADVQAFLGELGYAIPGALLDPILCMVNKIIPCLDGAGYDDCTAKLILMYAAALMATSSGARRIKSQGAPSGASLRSITVTMASPGCVTRWRNWIPAAAPVNYRSAPATVWACLWWSGAANGVGFSSATAAADVYPGVGDHRYRPANDGVREERRRVVHQLRPHTRHRRRCAAMEGIGYVRQNQRWENRRRCHVWRCR